MTFEMPSIIYQTAFYPPSLWPLAVKNLFTVFQRTPARVQAPPSLHLTQKDSIMKPTIAIYNNSALSLTEDVVSLCIKYSMLSNSKKKGVLFFEQENIHLEY